MNQLDNFKIKQPIISTRKKLDLLTRKTNKSTDDQQKASKQNDNRNVRMNLRSNFKQQRGKIARERNIKQIAKRSDRPTKQMIEKFQREL